MKSFEGRHKVYGRIYTEAYEKISKGNFECLGEGDGVKLGQVPKWPKGADCKSVALVLQRFESSPAHHFCGCSSMVEQ